MKNTRYRIIENEYVEVYIGNNTNEVLITFDLDDAIEAYIEELTDNFETKEAQK